MIIKVITKIEEERELNKKLLKKLLEGMDADIDRLTLAKRDLVEEFSERDASLLSMIEGDPPLQQPKLPAKPETDDGE
jgi:hypothetical protein